MSLLLSSTAAQRRGYNNPGSLWAHRLGNISCSSSRAGSMCNLEFAGDTPATTAKLENPFNPSTL